MKQPPNWLQQRNNTNMTRYSYDSEDDDDADFQCRRAYEAYDQLQLDLSHDSAPRPPISLTPLNSYSPSHACPAILPVSDAHMLEAQPSVQPPKLSRKLSRFSIRSLSSATAKTPSLLPHIPSLTTTSSSLRHLWTKSGTPPSHNSGKPVNLAPHDEISEKKHSLFRRFIFKQERSSLSTVPVSGDAKNVQTPRLPNAPLPMNETHSPSLYYQKAAQQPQAVQFSVCKLGPEDQATSFDNIPKRGFSILAPFKEDSNHTSTSATASTAGENSQGSARRRFRQSPLLSDCSGPSCCGLPHQPESSAHSNGSSHPSTSAPSAAVQVQTQIRSSSDTHSVQSELIATAVEASFPALAIDPSARRTLKPASVTASSRRLTKFRSLFELRSRSTETEHSDVYSASFFEKLFPKRLKSATQSLATECELADSSLPSPMSSFSPASPLSPANRRSKSPGSTPIVRRRQLGVSVSIVEDPSPVENSDALSTHSTSGSWKYRPSIRRVISSASMFSCPISRMRMDQQQKEILEEAWSSMNQDALVAQVLHNEYGAATPKCNLLNALDTPPASPKSGHTRSLGVAQVGNARMQATLPFSPPIPAIPSKWLSNNASSPLHSESGEAFADQDALFCPPALPETLTSSSVLAQTLGLEQASSSDTLRRGNSLSNLKGATKRGLTRRLIIDTSTHQIDVPESAGKEKNGPGPLSRLYPGL
ncbi:hypothetical protein BJ741DRAFT_581761 [Chytriomyces cf. hyalinus JEL632]|nr:hypothetical protein BJ741DRAFT_581761 [Chytriomyces cf. hyalinus JEL632]